MKKDQTVEDEELKDSEDDQDENMLKIQYKLSVLPDQPVLDCLSFQ